MVDIVGNEVKGIQFQNGAFTKQLQNQTSSDIFQRFKVLRSIILNMNGTAHGHGPNPVTAAVPGTIHSVIHNSAIGARGDHCRFGTCQGNRCFGYSAALRKLNFEFQCSSNTECLAESQRRAFLGGPAPFSPRTAHCTDFDCPAGTARVKDKTISFCITLAPHKYGDDSNGGGNGAE